MWSVQLRHCNPRIKILTDWLTTTYIDWRRPAELDWNGTGPRCLPPRWPAASSLSKDDRCLSQKTRCTTNRNVKRKTIELFTANAILRVIQTIYDLLWASENTNRWLKEDWLGCNYCLLMLPIIKKLQRPTVREGLGLLKNRVRIFNVRIVLCANTNFPPRCILSIFKQTSFAETEPPKRKQHTGWPQKSKPLSSTIIKSY